MVREGSALGGSTIAPDQHADEGQERAVEGRASTMVREEQESALGGSTSIAPDQHADEGQERAVEGRTSTMIRELLKEGQLAHASRHSFSAQAREAFDAVQVFVADGFFLKPHGSVAQGVAVPGTSDLDLVLCKTDAEFPTKKQQCQWLKEFSAGIPKARFSENHLPPKLRVERTIVRARVPIVRLLLRDEDRNKPALQIDLSAGDSRRGLADEAIWRILANGKPKHRAFVRLVKIYANGYRLNDTRRRGCSSLAWTLLAIFFLQQRGELGPLVGAVEELECRGLAEMLGKIGEGEDGTVLGGEEDEQLLDLWFREFLRAAYSEHSVEYSMGGQLVVSGRREDSVQGATSCEGEGGSTGGGRDAMTMSWGSTS